MIRVVLDANTLASAAVARPGGTLARLLDLWLARAFQVFLSPHIETELARTLEDRYFVRRLSQAQRAGFLALVRRRVTIVPITTPLPGLASHPEDDLVLATAESVGAEYLVTGDQPLLQLGHFRGTTILSPRAFVERLEAEEP